jgi:hypothetical protein
MALQHWAFFFTGAEDDITVHTIRTAVQRTDLVHVPTAADAVPEAVRLVTEGVQLIELCGAFGPVWVAKIIEATGGSVPVGAVGYGPEAVDQVHQIFA